MAESHRDFLLGDVKRLTNRFHVAMRLFSKRSKMSPKCGTNKTWSHVSLMFLPHFNVFCAQLLNKRTLTWNIYNKKLNIFYGSL